MASVDKILIGSPTYKTVVGNVTRIHKVVVGTPLSTVVIGPYADIDNIVGLDTTGKVDGGIISYDSDSGNFVVGENPLIEVDGKTYPSDSAHTNILIRRSGTQGEPVKLQQGEIAYSFLSDPATDGFGNGGDRLYIAIGENNDSGYSTEIDVIGGTYFTNLLNHQQGVLTPNSALLVDNNKRINEILADSATFLKLTSDEIYANNFVNTPIVQNDSLVLKGTTDNYIVATNGAGVEVYYNNNVTFQTASLTGRSGTTPGLLLGDDRTLQVGGLSFLDSTTIDGDLTITKNLVVQGETTSIETTELLIEDKRIVIANGVPNAVSANQSGIAVGDSSSPIASITYVNNGVDSECWEFNPGICAPKLVVDELRFEVVDCGTYA
jgi:hypothetical protein